MTKMNKLLGVFNVFIFKTIVCNMGNQWSIHNAILYILTYN